MEALKFELKYETVTEDNKNLPVIIVAAGSSSRMNGINKQFLEINGKPVIVKTCLKFQRCNRISRIIIVTKEELVLPIQKLCEEYKLDKVSDITVGGDTRTQSVINGMKRLKSDENKVLIHDGARPFVTEDEIIGVCDALRLSDSALSALCITDTVHRTDGEGTVTQTVDRTYLFSALTPQGVTVDKYLSVCEKYDSSLFTDDVSVMQKGGYKTVIVNGNRKNIKITTRDDITLAKVYAQLEESGE